MRPATPWPDLRQRTLFFRQWSFRRVGIAAGVLIACGVISSAATSAAEPPDFVHQIAPVLRAQCGKCHLGASQKGGFSLNTRQALLAGGEEGKAVISGRSEDSPLISRVTSQDPDFQMPPEGPRLSGKQVQLLKAWIDAGVAWDEDFVFQPPSYEPPLKPRRPELPPPQDGRNHPIDRLLDVGVARDERPKPLDDAAFARRSSLDLTGLLPDVERLQSFLRDSGPDRRERWIRGLLAAETDYAEHWLTFWNDLLRNDYGGTGFITGGRKQISKWLYQSLVNNKPYDAMVRELIAPTAESAGFSEGIRWRGNVSAGQTVEIQFAQSVGQAFLGINLKCASCHDSFIDRWKLTDAYGLAAIYAGTPLTIHRCDVSLGRNAEPKWMFPELGQVAATEPQPERLRQLAALMTHPENGRVPRTIVNRLWHRLMGHGIVHPVDAMQTEPWNADLLDFLAADFAEHHYDLKHTLTLIATSQAYQSQAEILDGQREPQPYAYRGPRAKRMTAEQFVDAVWQITGTAPSRFDAPVIRGKVDDRLQGAAQLTGQWVWSRKDASSNVPAAGETCTIRRKFTLPAAPLRAGAVVSCDNSCECFVNGQKVLTSDNWEAPESAALETRLRAGENEIVIAGKNGGTGPNPAAIFCELLIQLPDGTTQAIATDASWEWTAAKPKGDGKFAQEPSDWAPAVPAANQQVWSSRLGKELLRQLNHVVFEPPRMVRAALLKSDFLQRTLGRPNRDQIVTSRPNELSTLEAIDLNNAQGLADSLARGAGHLLARFGADPGVITDSLYLALLSREPTTDERAFAVESLGAQATPQGVQDLLWAILLQPEFQLVR